MGKKEKRRRRKKEMQNKAIEAATFEGKRQQNNKTDEKMEEKASFSNLGRDTICIQDSHSTQKYNCNSVAREKNLGSMSSSKSSQMKVKLSKTTTSYEKHVKNDTLIKSKLTLHENKVLLYDPSWYSSRPQTKPTDNFFTSDSEDEYACLEPKYYGAKPKNSFSFRTENSEDDLNRPFNHNGNDLQSCAKPIKGQSSKIFTSERKKTITSSSIMHEKYSKHPDSTRSLLSDSDTEEPYDKKCIFKSQNLHSDNMITYQRTGNEFTSIYLNWLEVRQGTLKGLEKLVHDIHKEQLEYNKAQKACREIGLFSRELKNCAPSAIGLLASVSAFVTDAASGIVSAAQAFNVDFYQTEFQTIMEKDATATKGLYKAMSQNLRKYQEIEEVIRKFDTYTFSSTVTEISNALELKKVRIAAENTCDGNDKAVVISNFINKAFQSETLEDMGSSITNYVDANPAALEVCKSASRAAVGVFDSLGMRNQKSPLAQGIQKFSNTYMILEDKKEISRLESTIGDDLPQTKFETKLKKVMDILESEMEEIVYDYMQHQQPYSYLETECDDFQFEDGPDYDNGFFYDW